MPHFTTSHSFFELGHRFYSEITPTPLRNCQLVHKNPDVAAMLGLKLQELTRQDWLILAGQIPHSGFKPLAMKYTGHQFGVYNPELGDGRGLLLTEFEHDGLRWDLHIKGSGKTPYSRFGDGRAVLRSSIREYLAGEALNGLNIASTRALALFNSDEPVMRESMERGALLLRIAQSHVRFGHFEHFHYTGQHEQIKQLAHHIIEQHYPQDIDKADRHLRLLKHTITRTAKMIAQWQAVGFTHGVMNTDNMSIIGDTFDFGPYGFMDDYQPEFVCNHSDHQGRYAFNQQPGVGLWNLNALAHALSTLIDTADIQQALGEYEPQLIEHYAQLMRQKLGLLLEDDQDQQLLSDWLLLLEKDSADYTLSFRALCRFDESADDSGLQDLFVHREFAQDWSQRYAARLKQEKRSKAARHKAMTATNPKFILRNSLAQKAISAAETGNYSVVNDLFNILQNPFAEWPEFEHYAKAPKDREKGLALSCSS